MVSPSPDDMNRFHFTQDQILGLDDSALLEVDGHRLLPEVADALEQLCAAAARCGFELRIASGYRSYARQLMIWDNKLTGKRPVLDADDQVIDLETLSIAQRLEAVLRFSALPGTSRHHWGTDLDVFDAAAVDSDYCVQLNNEEVSEGGCFTRFHDWLDERIASGESFGFYRPYDRDRAGVAPERWHLSYAPLARECQNRLDAEALVSLWRRGSEFEPVERAAVERQLEAIFERYVHRVAAVPNP
ncbi:MAG: M15 family metallopeptidase [Congregibacter sp.]